jgi:hypothetical protein
MAAKKTLDDIFDDDPFGLLNVKAFSSNGRNEDERLVLSFEEINDFYEKNQREPHADDGIQEHTLFSRLDGLRRDTEKKDKLREYDRFGLLDDDTGMFDFTHIQRPDERASTDFVARRKYCNNFNVYESEFKEVQKELSIGKRELIQFKEDNLREGQFYVHNGILLLLEHVNYEHEVQQFKSGSRVRKDGRTRVIFENGTESNMLYRSLYKALLDNGKAVTENKDKTSENFEKRFNNISDEDKETGYIYILKSKSEKPEIKGIKHLYKIGFSTTSVEERIKNAAQEPTYLMAEVRIVMTYQCYNMNPQQLELLLHNFFGGSCLNMDVFDNIGNRHTPREWFIAPLSVIEEAVKLIISGDIVKYRYDSMKEEIVAR